MEPYSYFLPKSHLTASANNGLLTKEHEPVFSYSFPDIDIDDFRYICDCKEPLCVSEYGKNILFKMKKRDQTILYKSYQFCDNKLDISKVRTFLLGKDYEHRLYDYNEEICFLFMSELVISNEEKLTNIYISYMIWNDSNECKFVENAIVLQYKYFFNKYLCFLSTERKKIVIITGNYKYGFKKSHNELCDSYLHILSYIVGNDSLDIEFHQDAKRNVTDECMGNYIDLVYFTIDGSKLILVSSREYCLIVYSLTRSTFGDVYLWNESLYETNTFFCAYHKDLGNIFIICESNGGICILKENHLNMQLLEGKSLSLCDLGFPFETFDFFIVDYFENIIIYVLAESSNVLLMVDCFHKKIIGKYLPDTDCRIIDLNVNWSGEEVFLFISTPGGGFDLKILYINKTFSLKYISKLVVLQIYSIKNLKEMNLPKMLKRATNPRFYQ